MKNYRLFSADSHLEISPERWTRRVPVKYRDRAPRLVKLANGGDGIVIEDSFGTVPEDEKNRILADNAREFFHLD
jgi:hypothetical protein